MKQLLKLAEKILFRLSFAVCILIAVIASLFLLAALGTFFRSDNRSVAHLFFGLFLLGLFPIGAGSYLVFRTFTRAEYVVAESERWLAERHQSDKRSNRQCKILKRWALWIPTVTVILACVFFDRTWAFASHLLHPGYGKLVGYEMSVPFTWAIRTSETQTGAVLTRSILVAERYRGLLQAGSGLYPRSRPPFSVSGMNFWSVQAGDAIEARAGKEVISTQTFPFGKSGITCWEQTRPHWMANDRYLHCSTPTGDFSANFYGNDEDVAAFYSVLRSVKPTE